MLRLECKVIHHAHQESPCSIAQCMERRTQHNALIRDVNGRWRNWTTTLEFPIRVCRNILSKTSVLRHDFDFATLATRTQISEFKEHLSKHLLVKHIATLDPRPQLLDACEVRFLNRVKRLVVPPFGKAPQRIEIEADPRHSELLVLVCKPTAKECTHQESVRDSSRTVKFSPQDATSYRSNVMRLAHLSADRIELQCTKKELARAMAESTMVDVEALKRKNPRCIQSFE